MNGVIARITLGQLVSRRRTILLLLLGAVLVAVALIFRLAGDEGRATHFTVGMLSGLGVATLMPLVALVLGTGAFGAEIEDGTLVYLLAKPLRRAGIVITKLAVAAACSVALTSAPIFIAGLVALRGLGDGLLVGFTVAAAIGSLLYCTVFVALSLVTRRALVLGLVYVVVWEGLLAGLFAGTRTFSVRQQTLAFADALAGVPNDVFQARLDVGTALVVAILVVVGGTLLAIRRLGSFEISGETA